MDCRKTLGLGLCLLIGTAGCMRHEAQLPVVPPAASLPNSGLGANTPTAVPVDAVPTGAVVKKATDLPKRPPQAATCVAFGEFAANEANAPDLSDSARQAKREQARLAFQQAMTIDPHCMQAYLALADLYVAMKDHAHAEATYRKVCQEFPNEARAFFEMGRCYGGEKQWDDAIHCLARAVELDPENRPYVDTLGWMEARAGRYDESLTTFRNVYDYPEAEYRLALMLDHLNQTDLCRQHLQAALSKDPQMERAKALLARLETRNDGAVQAASFTESAKPTSPAPAPQAAVETPSAPAADPPQKAAPTGTSVVLPPPPRIPIRYEDAVATPPTAPVPAPPPGSPPVPDPG